jgi:uncharacterized protein (DUF1697 family)
MGLLGLPNAGCFRSFVIRYVALFAGMNVEGNRLKMADLRYAFEREEFAEVETVVASGNVLFSFDERPTDGLEELFAHMMRDRFDMTSFVAVRTAEEVRAAIEDNPFSGVGDDAMVHTHFLARQPSAEQFAALVADHASRGPEKLAPGNRSLFVDYGSVVAGSRLTGAFMAKRLGCAGTARDMRSLARIFDKMR